MLDCVFLGRKLLMEVSCLCSFVNQVENGGKESQAGYKFATTDQAIWTLKIRYQVKEFSILCMGRCKPLGSLNSFLSYAPLLSEAKSCFLVHFKECWMAAFCISTHLRSPAITLDGGVVLGVGWGGVAASLGSQFKEHSFTFGGQKSLMLVTFLVYW